MGPHAGVPPDAFGLGSVFRQQEFKPAFTIIAGLVPGALPQAIDTLRRCKTPALLRIGAIAGFVQGGLVAFVVLHFEDFPFTAQVCNRRTDDSGISDQLRSDRCGPGA